MESINETLEIALQFLSILQISCDKKRLNFEKCIQQSFESYVKERKAAIKNIEKESDKELNANCVSKNDDIVSSLNKDFEELSLADTILEKARAIRSKSQSLPRCTVAPDNVSSPKSSGVNALVESSKNSSKITRDFYCVLPQSKSMPSSFTNKINEKFNSKSVTDLKASKGNSVLNKESGFRKISTVTLSKQLKCRTLDSGISVVSRKNLNEFKCLPSNHYRKTEKKAKTSCVSSSSGSPQNAIHHSHSVITYQSYKSEIKRTLELKSDFQLSNKEIWYPFMSSKNKKSLIKWAKCTSYESFMKIVNLIYEIQELMMWIDLLSLIGKDVLPCLMKLDDKDKNTVRLCSYLSSIYHESLQRIPMLSFD